MELKTWFWYMMLIFSLLAVIFVIQSDFSFILKSALLGFTSFISAVSVLKYVGGS